MPLAVLTSLYPQGHKRKFVINIVAAGCVFGTLFVISVALLGWSSFEFDTIQGNG